MNMWGVNKKKKVDTEVIVKEKKESEVMKKHKKFDTSGSTSLESKEINDSEKELESTEGNFLKLTTDDMKNYRNKLIRLPGVASQRERIQAGIAEGIPMEYFVDANILTDKNICELDLEMEELSRVYEYIQLKFPESDLVIGNDADKYSNDTIDKECKENIYDNEDKEETEETETEKEETENDNKKIKKVIKVVKNKNTLGLDKSIESEINKKDSVIISEDKEPEIYNDNNSEDYEEIKMYSQKEIDESITNINHENDIKLQAIKDGHNLQIKELNKTLDIKEESIKNLKEQIKNLNENIKANISKLTELRKDMLEYKEDIRNLNNDIYKLERIKSTYESIKEEYIRYKDYYENQSKIYDQMVERYESQLQDYVSRLETVERERDNIQEIFNEFYNNSNEDVSYVSSASTTSNVIYFKILGEPRYFYSVVGHLINILKSKGKSVLEVCYKNTNEYTKNIFNNWINIKDITSKSDINSDIRGIHSVDMDKVMATKLEAIMGDYDIVVVYDYIVGDNLKIISSRSTELVVIKNKKHQEILGIQDKGLVSEDHYEELDIRHSEEMKLYTNNLVRMSYYRGLIGDWVDKVINKDIELQ